MTSKAQIFQKSTERTNMYTLCPTNMVPGKGFRKFGTFKLTNMEDLKLVKAEELKLTQVEDPSPVQPSEIRLYRDQVPAGMYESRITDIRLLSDAGAAQCYVFDVVHHIPGIGDVNIQYTTGYNPRYKNFEYALVRYGLGSIKSSLGLEEMIEVSYRDGEDLGEISWRDTLSNYLKYSAPPPANTQ